MSNESTPQHALTRRELRELERMAEREALLAEQREREAAAAAVIARPEPVAEPAFTSRRERREAERAAAAAALAVLEEQSRLTTQRIAAELPGLFAATARQAERTPVAAASLPPAPIVTAPAVADSAPVEVAPVQAAPVEAAPAEPDFVEAAVVEPVFAESTSVDAAPAEASRPVGPVAALIESVDSPVDEASAPLVESPFAPQAPAESVAARPAPTAASTAERVAPEVAPAATERVRTASITTREFAAESAETPATERIPAARVATDLPIAPEGEPTIEFAAAFARPTQARSARARRAMADARREATGRRINGPVALGFIAGTAVLGVGSAVVLGAMGSGSPAAADPQAEAQPVAEQHLTVGAAIETAAAPRSDEATAVTAIGSAAAANLATGVKQPDATTYTNNITANVQWPFPVGVKLTDLYGPRVSPTAGASSWHGGVDFTPGEGTPIGAIADGVVNYVQTADDGGLGVFIEVEHVINGQRVTSVYAHLLPGTATLKVGDVVGVGDVIGQVGDTGMSTGPHLHLEIRFDGNTVDPIYFFQKLNTPGVEVTLPTEPQKPVHPAGEKIGIAESHALIDQIVR